MKDSVTDGWTVVVVDNAWTGRGRCMAYYGPGGQTGREFWYDRKFDEGPGSFRSAHWLAEQQIARLLGRIGRK